MRFCQQFVLSQRFSLWHDSFRGRQGLIAGRLPNQPGVLMQFVRNAPALVPGTAMPAVVMTDQEARDVTAYLLKLQSR